MTNRQKKILIVEDSRSIRELLTYTLEDQLHIDIAAVSSMAEAKHAIEVNPDGFYLAILDLNLPDAPNGEIVDYILSQNIPPIILTGSLSDDMHADMMEKPIIDYVIKRNMNEFQYVTELVSRLYRNADRKVLVVDDSKSSRQHIRALLERHYLDVYEANDGVEALTCLDAHPDIILIITDYNMPEMDGLSLISKVREIYSRNELSIIGISSQGKGTLSIKLLKSGANDFISRPFLHEEFYCRVNHNIDSIDNYRLLRDAATSDYLTGLSNRKYLYEAGEKLFNNAKRDHISLTAAIIDIDYFKKINDTYGHYIGDLALKHISNILKQQIRDGDIVARMGGEEFCIICINLAHDKAAQAFDRIRSSIADQALILEDGTKINITASIGFCEGNYDSLDTIINNADHALYDAKESGRNRVCTYTDTKKPD